MCFNRLLNNGILDLLHNGKHGAILGICKLHWRSKLQVLGLHLRVNILDRQTSHSKYMKTAIINISLAVALASAICGYWKTTGILCAIVLIIWITSDKPEWS